VAIETAQDAIGTLCSLKGFPGVVLKIKHIHGDYTSSDWSDARCCWGTPPSQPAACVVEVVAGSPPSEWPEPCTPFGHYRFRAKDLILEGEAA